MDVVAYIIHRHNVSPYNGAIFNCRYQYPCAQLVGRGLHVDNYKALSNDTKPEEKEEQEEDQEEEVLENVIHFAIIPVAFGLAVTL